MSYRFGDFELDENARALTLRGAIEDVQPRVLELLCYIVRNAGRVVPKDELLDELWPGVIVTESSLQRAVSLARRTLAKGGLGDCIQNFAKRGYRFALDDPRLDRFAPAIAAADDGLGAARQAAFDRDWESASTLFARASAMATIGAEDLELWALADECRGRPVDAIPALTRAVELHLAEGRAARAGRVAVTLAKVELERSAGARAQGWLERAREILEAVDDPGVHAYLNWMLSRLATVGGRAEEALSLASRAAEFAERSGDQGLRALTMAYEGFYNLSLGRVDEGNRLQNHAAAIALSSQVDPITGSLVYCNILWSCRTYADWERALQWSDGFEEWCRASFAENPGACDLHRAEVLSARGALPEAFEKISGALPKLSAEESWALGEGHRVRGDIAAMLGNTDDAVADYTMAYSLGWDAEPGNAILLAERGEHEAALAAIDRALEGTSWFHLQRKGQLLANGAKIAAHAGQRERANRYLALVEAEAGRWPQPSIRAVIAEARADLLSGAEALQMRLLARQLWTSGKVEFHAARVRLELAAAYLAAGDVAGAEAELSAAERSAKRVASPRLVAQCTQLRGRIVQRRQGVAA